MAKRGRILSDPTAGPGRVMVQGRQHVFGLDGVWRSDALPRPGVVVDVEFDEAGRISAMMVVPEARLAREQVEAALDFARLKGVEVGAGLATGVGLTQLAALLLLIAGWFWLGTFEIDGALPGQGKVTFWNLLALLNADRSLDVIAPGRAPAPGLYRIAALLCLAGPLLAHVWRDKRAHLAALLPLAFMLIVVLPSLELLRPAAAKTVSLGAGAYLSALAGLYFAFVGSKRFLVAQACDEPVFYENEP